MDIAKHVSGGFLKVLAKPNSGKTEVLGYDESRKAVKIAVSAPADKNKANQELVKFVSKLLKKKVTIKAGMASKEKLLKIS